MSGSIGIASEKVRKEEEVVREEKILDKVDISPTFTQDYTNGHDMRNCLRFPYALARG
ncbi:hypothetical protein [Hydrocoleum sp. CS-953]|uniref:hypothetical protein n=1 Tax=Microcoleaceae TaxID=1892252 RepID=UPI001AF0164C|nr:hypothetical protein [Hydrocoleum sp. CS-953]